MSIKFLVIVVCFSTLPFVDNLLVFQLLANNLFSHILNEFQEITDQSLSEDLTRDKS